MTAGTPLLGSLGQRQDPSGTVRPYRHFHAASPESSERELEAGVNALPSWSTIDELTKVHEYKAQTLAWVAKVLSRTDQSDFFHFKKPEFPSDVGRLRLHAQHRLQRPFGVAEIGKAITLAAESSDAPPFRGRITGPVKFVNKLLATWHLEPESACILLGFERSRFAYVNDVLQGYETLTGRDAKDRIVHLIQIRTSLSTLFRDEAVENEWLTEPHDTLNGKKPMDLLLEGSMENLLLVKEYVELVART